MNRLQHFTTGTPMTANAHAPAWPTTPFAAAHDGNPASGLTAP